jgi:5-hydroxyisourate hydrolase
MKTSANSLLEIATMSSPITTHVLDTSIGKPAAGVAVALERLVDGNWQAIGSGTTNSDGRVADLLSADSLTAGRFRLTFAVEEYFEQRKVATFYPSVAVEFMIAQPQQHYHVPLLISPFGYSTYRGS